MWYNVLVMKNNFRFAIAAVMLVFMSGCGNAPKDNTPEAVAMFCIERLMAHNLTDELLEKYFVSESAKGGWQSKFYEYDVERKKKLSNKLDKDGVTDRAIHYVHTQTFKHRKEDLWGIGIKEYIGADKFTGTFYVVMRMVDGQWRVVNLFAGNLNIEYKDNEPVWENVWSLD